MGLEAVRAAFLAAPRLGDRHAARSLLVWLAFNCYDEPRDGRPALTYWGGYKHAAMGLGYSLTDDDESRARAAMTAVKRTMRVLEDESLILRVQRAGYHRTAVWLLTLSPAPVDKSPARSRRGGRSPISEGSVTDPTKGSKTDHLRGRSSTPLPVGAEEELDQIWKRAHARAQLTRNERTRQT